MSKLVVFLAFTVFFASAFLPNSVLSANNRENVTQEITRSFHDNGFAALTFSPIDKDTVAIRHSAITQDREINAGEMVSLLGTILKPEVVKKLKTAGFKKGVVIDGRNRQYSVELSTKYYEQMEAFYKKLSGGK